jgi:hypothetical protein
MFNGDEGDVSVEEMWDVLTAMRGMLLLRRMF